MGEMTADSWRRQGSSVVWHTELLTPLITEGKSVSLREALLWLEAFPSSPTSSTILIGGLQPCLELLEPGEGLEFLRKQILPLIRVIQDCWPNVGLVFGMKGPGNLFRMDERDELVYMKLKESGEVSLSSGLWSGAARDAFQIMFNNQLGGFHVRRVS